MAFPFSGPQYAATSGWSSTSRASQSMGSFLCIAMLCLFRFHPYFRVKHMKPAFPPAKGLFNAHPGSCMGLVVCFLFRCCWVEVGGHQIRLTRYPLSPRSKPFSSEKDWASSLCPIRELLNTKLSCVLPGHLATMLVNIPEKTYSKFKFRKRTI